MKAQTVRPRKGTQIVFSNKTKMILLVNLAEYLCISLFYNFSIIFFLCSVVSLWNRDFTISLINYFDENTKTLCYLLSNRSLIPIKICKIFNSSIEKRKKI